MRDVEDEVLGVGGLFLDATDLAADAETELLVELVGRNEPGTDGAESRRGLAETELRIGASLELHRAIAQILADRVPRNHRRCLTDADLEAFEADDDDELGFPVNGV